MGLTTKLRSRVLAWFLGAVLCAGAGASRAGGQEPVATPVTEPAPAGAELVEVIVESGGLRIVSTESIRSISAMVDDDGRPNIVLADHRLGAGSAERVYRAGWLEKLEVRSEPGEALAFLRFILTPRQPIRFRLHQQEGVEAGPETVWLQIAGDDGSWLPIGRGLELEPMIETAAPVPEIETTKAPGPAAPLVAVTQAAPAGAPTSAVPASAGGDRRFVRARGRVNLRDGPAPKYRILGTVAKDVVVEVIGSHRGWYRVVDGERMGWLDGDYVEPSPEPPDRPRDDQPQPREEAPR